MTNIFQIKRGTTVKRLAYTPANGEFVLDTDTKKLYLGDGVTAGGLEVGGVDLDTAGVAQLTKENIFTNTNVFSGSLFATKPIGVTADSTAVTSISTTYPTAVVTAWRSVNFSSYKVTGDIKTHFGVIAQDIQRAFAAQGINAADYGLVESVGGVLTVRLEECLILEAYCSRISVAKADALTNQRTISLTGAVTGSGSFDGSANLSIEATVTGLGVVNGIATLDSTGKVPSAQLPSYVDDVLEYASVAAFPATGETGKIYVETTDNTTHRWSGSAYVKITSGEVSSVAGKTGVVTLVKGDVGLANVDNTADSAKKVASAAKLTAARTINGVAFDGTANITVVDSTKAPLASPELTGVPTAPTAATATNTTQLATTAFVQAVNAADTGSSATVLTLKTARAIAIAGAVTGSVSFNGGSDVTITSSFGDVDLGVL